MKSLKLLRKFTLCAAVLSLGQAAFGAADEPGKLLFLDSFEGTLKTQNGALFTHPAIYGRSQTRGANPIIGIVSGSGHAKLVEGKKGQALELSGDARVMYDSNFTAVNLFGGEVSFWVKLNFDPNVIKWDKKTREGYRNQIFLSFVASNGNTASFCTCLDNIEFAAVDSSGNVSQEVQAEMVWNQGEWHLLKLSWGNAVELWVDGHKKVSAPCDGLFGTLPVDLEKLRMYIGRFDDPNVDTEFTIEELTVRGPTPGNIGCRPRASVPLLEGAPALDGKLDDPFWQKAGKLTGFVGLSKRELDRDQPTVLIAYTEAGLYLGETIPLPDGRRPQAVLTAHNSSVLCTEDAFEIFLQPVAASPALYQLLANAIGTKAEYQYTDKVEPVTDYSPEWQVATSAREGEWTAEIFIPFKALGLSHPPKAGDVWGANFAVDSSVSRQENSAKSWAFADGDFLNAMTFGELLFTGKVRALREESFAGFSGGNPTIRFDLVGERLPVATVKAVFFDSVGKSVHDAMSRTSDTQSAVVGAESLPAGLYTVRLSGVDEADGVNTEVFRQNVLFRAVNPFSLTVENYPYAGVAEARAPVAAFHAKASQVTFQLLSPKGQALQTPQAVAQFQRGVATAKFNNTELQPGEYLVQATALDAQGKTLDTASHSLKIFAKPFWWKNDLGLDHSVPPPWTPVKATEKGFGVWGRDYQFGNGVFPKQIVNQGKPMFKAAPRFILRAGGKETNLVAANRQAPNQEFPDQIELTAATDAGLPGGSQSGVSARLKGTLDFDGCYRLDLDLLPNGGKTVDNLTLDLPLPREIGQLLLTSNGPSSTVTEIKDGFKGYFAPYLWLGNDDMGLALFTESDQYWNPRDAEAIQIIPSADTTLLRINIVRSPLALKGPISYSFGLMASPVRPIIDGDPFVWFRFEGASPITFAENLTYPAEGLTGSAEGTLEFWARSAKPDASGAAEVFSTLPADDHAQAGFIRCTAGSSIDVDAGEKRLLTGNVALSATEFLHLALVWTPKAVSLYVNGKRVAMAEATEAFHKAMEAAALPGGRLCFGDRSEKQDSKDPGVDVDDIRISGKARYEGEVAVVPNAPLTKDSEAKLLDPLDETFIPDGQDALTAAGGCPSIGCRFIAGKFGHALRIQSAPPCPAAEFVKEMNATFGMADGWENDPETGLEGMWAAKSCPPTFFVGVDPGLKGYVDRLHSVGLKVLPYDVCPDVGGPSPLADQWASEWAIKPMSPLSYPPPEGHYMLVTNLSARGFADYLVAGASWLIKDHGLDGIYTDGGASVSPSQNLYAGAGYVDETGVLRPTLPFFGVREAMKRLYRTVKSIKPDGLVCNHLSKTVLLPTLSFSDIHYTGELEDVEDLTVDRLRFSSRPWGLQEAMLGSSTYRYSSVQTMVALLHGTSILGNGGSFSGGFEGADNSRKWINLRKAYLAYDYKSAEWVPYFKNRDTYWATEDPKTKISLYYHPGKDAFLIVANTDAQIRTVNVQLHLKAFGLAGRALRARNALTQVPVALAEDGKLNVLVRAKSYVLVAVEPNP